MTYETILFDHADGIARLTLNRPDRLNSFTVQMHEEVTDALGRLEGARTLILTGAGRGFCAGQDLNDRAVAPGEAVDLGESVELRYNPLIRTLTALPMPVIARVNGVYLPLLEFIRFVGRTIILAYGGYLVAAGLIGRDTVEGVSAVVVAFLYWNWFMDPIVNFGTFYSAQLIPALTGALLVVNARMGEQQRPQSVVAGVLHRLNPAA